MPEVSPHLNDSHAVMPEDASPVVVVRENKKRWTAEQKLSIIRLTYLEGNTASSIARQYGISPAMLFGWRSKAKKGLLTSGHSAGEKTVLATRYAQALDEIQPLQKLLGRAVSDNELLKEAVEMMCAFLI